MRTVVSRIINRFRRSGSRSRPQEATEEGYKVPERYLRDGMNKRGYKAAYDTREEYIQKSVEKAQQASMGMERAVRIAERIAREAAHSPQIHTGSYYGALIHHTVRLHLYSDFHTQMKQLEKIVEIAHEEHCHVGFNSYAPYRKGHLELIIYFHLDHGHW